MSSDESARLIKMEDELHNRVIGQEEAVVAISRAIRRARVGLKSPNRPIASFIFSGTGNPLYHSAGAAVPPSALALHNHVPVLRHMTLLARAICAVQTHWITLAEPCCFSHCSTLPEAHTAAWLQQPSESRATLFVTC